METDLAAVSPWRAGYWSSWLSIPEEEPYRELEAQAGASSGADASAAGGDAPAVDWREGRDAAAPREEVPPAPSVDRPGLLQWRVAPAEFRSRPASPRLTHASPPHRELRPDAPLGCSQASRPARVHWVIHLLSPGHHRLSDDGAPR